MDVDAITNMTTEEKILFYQAEIDKIRDESTESDCCHLTTGYNEQLINLETQLKKLQDELNNP